MEIKGTIINVLPLESGVSKTNGNPWSKATIVVETEGQYPKKVAMNNMKNAEEFVRLPIGARGTFKIEVESREYKGKWYSDIRCWAYELEGQLAPPQQQYAQPLQPSSQQLPKGYGNYPSQQQSYPPQPQGYQQPPQQQFPTEEDIPF